MPRRMRFKQRLRDKMLANARMMEFMGMAAPEEKQEAVADLLRGNAAAIPAAPKRRKVVERMDGVDIDRIHGAKRAVPLENEVVHAISQLLAAHPDVLFAVRQNSGAASYEAKSGRYAPVHFYRLLTHNGAVTLPDFWGFLKSGRYFALEAKREGWTNPRDDREYKQANFLMLVRNCGGIGAFVRSADEAKAAIES